MKTTNSFARQNIVFAILFATFFGAVWLTTPRTNEHQTNRGNRTVELSVNAPTAPKLTVRRQHVTTP